MIPVGGEFPIVPAKTPERTRIALIRPGPNPYPRHVLLRDGAHGGVQSVDTSRSSDLPRRRRRTRVTPRSASDTAMTVRPPAIQPTLARAPPASVLGSGVRPPAPNALDDRYSTVGNQGASSPDQPRRGCGLDIRAEWSQSGVRRMDARAARMAPS
jgi:hypothetical protein